jgi:hypothetical protein
LRIRIRTIFGSWIRNCIKVKIQKLYSHRIEPERAVDAHNGGLEGIDHWSQIPITLNWSQIRIRIEVKSWIRIRIKRILNLTVGWVAPLLYDGEQPSCPPSLLAPGAPPLLIHAAERVTFSVVEPEQEPEP